MALLALTIAFVAPSHLVRLDTGIAGARIQMSPSQVRRVLGAPTRIRSGKWRVGYIARTYVYERRGIDVQFLLGGDRLYAYQITTRNPLDRTRRGIGVGSTEAEVRHRVPDVTCIDDRYVGRYCRRPNEGGVGGTSFGIRRGRVVRVSVFAPVF